MSNMEKLRADFNIDDISTEPDLVKAGQSAPAAEAADAVPVNDAFLRV